jgi:RNA polymerase sigma factor (sigma-70 family)
MIVDVDHSSDFGFDPATAIADASKGDRTAWDAIVAQYSSLVWSIARSYRLSSADAADVYQGTWLRLVEHLGDIRDATRLGAWLATTTRREALALIRRRDRDLPVGDSGLLDSVAADADAHVDDRILRTEEHRALWRAFERLGGNCQRLLRMAFTDPPPSYAEISGALEIPIGSIGPTRARCLANLQGFLDRPAPA